MRAASIRSFGSVMKKFRSRKMPNGSAKVVWVSQIGRKLPMSPRSR